jgi:exopolysaccharide production protein ExoQ
LRGIVGSKNQVAFISQILLLSSLTVAVDARAPRPLRLQAVTGIALAALEIRLAQSAGGLISSIAAVTAFAGVFLAGRLQLAPRIALIVGAVVTISPLLLVAKDVVEQVEVFQLNVLHKDATLTGRTGLWDFAHSLISERPILGHGFDAFWRQGNVDAEGLWQQFGIGSRMGFNFHNQFVEAQVDLGRVGLCVLIASLMFVGVPLVWRAIREPSLSIAFAVALLVALYIKLPVESVLIGSWDIYSLVFIAIGMKAIGGAALAAGSRRGDSTPHAWRRGAHAATVQPQPSS